MLQVDPRARILVAGQAPGRRVHDSGIPFADASGDRLRSWMGLDPSVFYDPTQIAILPMGFCYPGGTSRGDAPPRPECAPAWRARLLGLLPLIELTLVLGRHAHAYHLGDAAHATLTETVAAWRDYWPSVVPLPHPSPRNRPWLAAHPWFENELIGALRSRVAEIVTR